MRGRLGRSVILVAALAILLGAALALAATPASAAKPCWERVVDDWTDNTSIDGAYSIACLQAALERVPEDIRVYSNFEEQILQARQSAARQLQRAERPVRALEPEPRGLFDSALSAGAADSGSPPTPLIVLASVALFLLIAGAAGLLGRRLRIRTGDRRRTTRANGMRGR